ncbi:GDSL-like Lipase/Acylhydrolase family protein [Yersinia rochesterensis]|uniref:GDSL-like Lipase/Acylhydrolase family protein n=1 Tax=Yersinia rochesterensis TaxID=1604335 RepID=A0ABN4FC44_9GAMM|nr:GDSL-type esterase/lipase family protein [Yersinia rochesterensis]AJI86189.1 GDSL-like Lipase/Acylhydrolase family protein [Yersinia frederiksenii Y225]AJJ35099.1 GDSL-like Lipase/Acylhydrolase family protein [Yersinia rochesterensis]
MATIPTQNPVPSEAAVDLKFNAGKIDEFVTSFLLKYTDRLGREHLTIEGIRDIVEKAIKEFGWTTMDSFEIGATLANSSEVLRWESNGEYYRWDGSFPKVVPSGSTPETTGGIGIGAWVGIGDAALRAALASIAGANMIGTQSGGTVQSKLDEIDNSIEGSISSDYRVRNIKALAVANKKLKSRESFSVVCVGDSITAGYDQTSPDRIPADNGDWATHAPIQYPSQLQSVLRVLTGTLVTVVNRGYSGDTAKLSYNRWTTNPNSSVAHIMIGLNDSDGVAGATFDEYSNYIELMIRKYIDWGCGVVIHTPTAKQFGNTNQPSNFFGQYAMALAEIYGCPVFNAHEVNQHCLYTGVYSDSTHFNAAGYAKLGDAVAAFVMSGGWAGQHRSINSLTSIQSGRSGEGIGFFSVGASLSTNLSGAYLTNGAVGLFPATTVASMAFSFYLDADVANLYVIGEITGATMIMSDTYGKGDGAISRLTTKSLQNRHVFETTRTTIQSGRTSAGRNSLVGSYVGRGWKNLVVQYSGEQPAEHFLQGIIIEPVKASEATQTNANNIRKAFDEVYVMQIPQYSYGSPATIPTAIILSGDYFFPLPDGLYPFVGVAGNYFDSAPVRVTITTFGSSDTTANPNGVTEILLSRQSGGTTLKIDKIYGSSANSILPTAAGVGSSAYTENVTSPTGVSKTTFPSTTQQGWLWMTFTSTATAFYRIEVRCASKGGQGTWLA